MTKKYSWLGLWSSMNLLAGKRDPLDFVLLAVRSGYFFPTKVNY